MIPLGRGRKALDRRALALGVLALALAGCGPSTSPAPATQPPGPTPSAAATSGSSAPSGTPDATPTQAPAPFDPHAVTIRTESVTSVPGGPLGFTALPDGRMYVASQDGRAWLLDGNRVARDPIVDLRDRILSGGERGLLGIAVHPRFPDDPRVFVHYTDRDGDTVVSSLTANDDGTRLDASSERVILRADQPYGNHNGGAVAFGPDGYLYISLGDGGSGGDPHGYGQALDTVLGKILRLDIDDTGGGAYGIPDDNPFAGGGGRPEIWHYGLRNPWRISFDRETGDLWIGDVGQGQWEEVDVAREAESGGLNFGWNVMEGRHCFNADSCASDGLVLPVSEYDHSQGSTIIGGFVYRGSQQPQLRGGYLFTDYGSGRVWAIDAAAEAFQEPVEIGRAGSNLAAFGEDVAGELFLANLDGTISRLIATPR